MLMMIGIDLFIADIHHGFILDFAITEYSLAMLEAV